MWDPGHCETPVFGIVMLVILFLILLVVALQVRKKFMNAKQRRSLIRKHLEETEEKQEEVRKEIELMQKAWQINWDRIRIGKKIAAGGQGVVYQGTLSIDLGELGELGEFTPSHTHLREEHTHTHTHQAP
jgi:predicted Holliday junction resolvase-like endonuclease